MKGKQHAFILFLLLSACTAPENKSLPAIIKHNTKKYIAGNVADTPGYQPVSFSGLDSIVQSYLNDKIYLQYDDSLMEVEAVRFREMGENFKLFQHRKATGFYDKKQAYFKRKRDSVAKVIEPEFVGYKLEHQFTITDTTGAEVLNKYVFCFDKEGNLLSVLK